MVAGVSFRWLPNIPEEYFRRLCRAYLSQLPPTSLRGSRDHHTDETPGRYSGFTPIWSRGISAQPEGYWRQGLQRAIAPLACTLAALSVLLVSSENPPRLSAHPPVNRIGRLRSSSGRALRCPLKPRDSSVMQRLAAWYLAV